MTNKKSLLTFLCFLFCFATIAQQTESQLQLTSNINRKLIYEDTVIILSLTIYNAGGSEAAGVLVMNNLPQELAFDSFLNEGKATHNAGSVLWFAENVEIGKSKTLEIAVNIKNKNQPIINHAFVWQYDGVHMFFDYNSTPENLRTELVITDVNLIKFEEIAEDIIVVIEEETAEEEIVETEEIEVEVVEAIKEETTEEIGKVEIIKVEEEIVEEITTEEKPEEDLEKLKENLTKKIKRIEAELEKLKKLHEEETSEEEETVIYKIPEEIEKTEEIELLKIEKQALHDWLKNTINSQGEFLVQVKNNQVIKVIEKNGSPAMTKQNISWPTAIFKTGKKSSITELELEITIFNRFAVAVYEGSGGWDLMYNGTSADSGIYFYVVKFPDGEKLSNSFEIQRQ